MAYCFRETDDHGCLDGIQPKKVQNPFGHFAADRMRQKVARVAHSDGQMSVTVRANAFKLVGGLGCNSWIS